MQDDEALEILLNLDSEVAIDDGPVSAVNRAYLAASVCYRIPIIISAYSKLTCLDSQACGFSIH